jgi:transposase
MRPYGTDLRRRLLDAYQRGEGSVRELADLFELAPGTVQNWLTLARETGSAAPRPHRGGFPARMTTERRELLWLLVLDDPDATLPQLAERFAQATGCCVHPSTLSRALTLMEVTLKKRRSTRRNAAGPMYSGRDWRSASGSSGSPDTA